LSLFKILKGDSSRIDLETTPFHDGYAYFTPDDGGFYIDSEDDSEQRRIRINPDADWDTLQNKPFYDEITSIEDFGTVEAEDIDKVSSTCRPVIGDTYLVTWSDRSENYTALEAPEELKNALGIEPTLTIYYIGNQDAAYNLGNSNEILLIYCVEYPDVSLVIAPNYPITIQLQKVENTLKTLPSKFLDIESGTKTSLADGIVLAQDRGLFSATSVSNYEALEGEVGHIENRPFYDDPCISRARSDSNDIWQSGSYQMAWAGYKENSMYGNLDSFTEVTVYNGDGSTLFSGEIYVVPGSSEYMKGAGNIALRDHDEPPPSTEGGECFLFFYPDMDEGPTLYSLTPLVSPITFEFKGRSLKQLDEKFIPDTIARVEDLENFASSSETFDLIIPTSGWSESAPYTIQLPLEGIKETHDPIATLRLSNDAATRAAENEAFSHISLINTYDDYVIVTCDEEIPQHEITVALKTTVDMEKVEGVDVENVVGLNEVIAEKYDAPLRFRNVAVAGSLWVNDATYEGYAYKCDIALSDVTADMVPDVILPLSIAVGGEVAPISETGDGYVRLYASAAQADMVIPTITVWKEV